MDTHHYVEMGFPSYYHQELVIPKEEHCVQMGFPSYDQGLVIPKEEEDDGDFFSFPPVPFDPNFSTWEHDLLPELGYFPPVSSLNIPLFTSADYASIPSEDFAFDSGHFGVKHELTETQNQPHRNRARIGDADLTAARREPKPPKIRDADNFGISKLSRKTISEHFYMPITQAAKELNIGLTQLKKRCREVGIRRWPHRKLMSLQTLIASVQKMGGDDVGRKRSRSIAILEQEKKLLEEIPDMELGEQTRKLRQSIFKANYKKRRTDNNVKSELVSKSNEVCGSSRDVIEIRDGGDYDRADEEFDRFLSDYFSSDYITLCDL